MKEMKDKLNEITIKIDKSVDKIFSAKKARKYLALHKNV